ncbi:hypothetical protein [Clostridium sp. KNHs205]|jgi:hypothetical protein|uniref:hypothetical protein n=1 Tax=Clostridium sp. KNHs205 TaxID=1449050 RepID=UPI00051BA6DA|nr:hypothetical protein [Clostridium sp. KNHs205]
MVKKIFSIAMYSIRQWVTDPRIISLFVLMSMFVWNDFEVIGDLTGITGIKTNPLIFPFFSSDPVKQLILLAGIVFLFSDAPFINKNQPYIIIRSKRIPWVLGQILYIIMASAIYFLFLMLVSILVLLPHGTFATDGWGKIINTLAQTDVGAQLKLQFGITKEITTFYSPWEAFGFSFLLDWGVACFLGLLLFVINLNFNRMLGLVAGGVILFFDLLVTNALPPTFYHFSPVSLSRLSVLDPMGVSLFPNLTYPFVFFSVSIVILSALLVVSIKKTPIEITSEL